MHLDFISAPTVLLAFLFGLTLAGQEIVLKSNDLVKHPTSEYISVDRDNNAKDIELDDRLGDLILRLDSMPSPGDFGIELIRENNLVLSPYIPNTKSAQHIKVTFQYDHNDLCPSYITQGVQCEDAFHLAVISASSALTDLRQINLPSAAAVVRFETISQTSSATSQNREFTINLPDHDPGFRVGFLDKGSKFDIKTLRVNQYICPSGSFQDGLLTCPDSSAWSNGTRQVECECDSVTAEPRTSGSNFVQCTVNGDYTPPTTPCKCKPGYSFTLKPGSTTEFECKAVTQPTVTTTTQGSSNSAAGGSSPLTSGQQSSHSHPTASLPSSSGFTSPTSYNNGSATVKTEAPSSESRILTFAGIAGSTTSTGGSTPPGSAPTGSSSSGSSSLVGDSASTTPNAAFNIRPNFLFLWLSAMLMKLMRWI